MSNSLTAYSDGRGGYCYEKLGIVLNEYFPSDEVNKRGIHPANTSRYTGEPMLSEAAVDIFGNRLTNLFDSQCEETIIGRL